MNQDELLESVSFTEKERSIWKFLGEYESKLFEWAGKHKLDDEQLLRHMLVSLFPYYRAYNHTGEVFNTNIINGKKTKKKILRYQIFNQISKKSINSIEDYLQATRISSLSNINEDSLFEFVLNGSCI